jgi:PIN domain nuclease of toxin-antitoxin system
VKLLLDTHALLWFLAADRRLGRRARDVIEAPANTVLISIVSLWEIALKSRLGKLRVDLDAVLDAVGRTDFERLDLKEPHLRVLAALPNVSGHRDPFDHLLIAQAQTEDLIFVSDDPWVRNYAVRHEPCSGGRRA